MASSPESLAAPAPAPSPGHRRGRLARLAGGTPPAALWAIAVLLWAVRVDEVWTLPNLGLDLRPIYNAGTALAQGKPLYGVHAFVYPPSAALLGRPMAFAPFASERHGAAVVVALMLIGSVVLGARAMGAAWFGTSTAAAVIALALVGLLHQALFLENLSALVALGAGGVVLAWRRGRDLLAGAVLGLTLAIKPMLAILLVGLLVLRRWRALLAAVAVPAALNALVLAFDSAAFRGVSGKMSDLLSGHGPSFDPHNGALVSIGRMIGMPSALTLGLRVLVGASAAAAAVLLWRRRPEPARSLEAGGVLLAGLYLTSTLYENHFFFVLVPFALACLEARSPFRWWPTAFFAALAAAVVAVPPATTGLTPDEMLSTQRGLALAGATVCVLVAAARLWVPPQQEQHRTRAPQSGEGAPAGSDELTKVVTSSTMPHRTTVGAS